MAICAYPFSLSVCLANSSSHSLTVLPLQIQLRGGVCYKSILLILRTTFKKTAARVVFPPERPERRRGGGITWTKTCGWAPGPTGDRQVQVGQFGAAVESGAPGAGFRMEARFEAPTSFTAVDWLRLLQGAQETDQSRTLSRLLQGFNRPLPAATLDGMGYYGSVCGAWTIFPSVP